MKLPPLPVAAPGKGPSGSSEEGGSGMGRREEPLSSPAPATPVQTPASAPSPPQTRGKAAPLGAAHTAGPARACPCASKRCLIFLAPIKMQIGHFQRQAPPLPTPAARAEPVGAGGAGLPRPSARWLL